MKKLILILLLLIPITIFSSPLHIGHAKVYVKYCITSDRHDTYDEESNYIREYCSNNVQVFYFFNSNNTCYEQTTFYDKSILAKLYTQLSSLTPVTTNIWIDTSNGVYYELLIQDKDTYFCIRNWK